MYFLDIRYKGQWEGPLHIYAPDVYQDLSERPAILKLN